MQAKEATGNARLSGKDERPTVRQWEHPDTSGVQLGQEDRAQIFNQAMEAVRSSYGSETATARIDKPTADWILKNHKREVEERMRNTEAEWRKRRVWKNRSTKPIGYVPSQTSDDLQSRLLAADTYFCHSNLKGQDLSGFLAGGPYNFDGSTFEGCRFDFANLDRATFRRCHFQNCTGFDSMRASGADFTDTTFTGSAQFSSTSRIEGAAFDGADLRDVKGLVFDTNSVYRTRFPKETSSDTWSKLRRKYNGFALFLSSLVLIVFLIPFVTKLVSLIAYDGVLRNEQQGIEWLRDQVPADAFKVIEGALAAHGHKINECGRVSGSCQQKYAIVAALTASGSNWWLQSAAILAALSFVLRYILTNAVARLREHEDRTSYTPGKLEYQFLAGVDSVLSVVRWPLMGYYLYVFYKLAFTEIFVPN